VRALKAAKAERAAVEEAIKRLQGLKLGLDSATKAYMAHADVSRGTPASTARSSGRK